MSTWTRGEAPAEKTGLDEATNPGATAFFRSLAPKPRKTLRLALEQLREDPSGKKHGLDVKWLEGEHAHGLRRLRVGKHRVIFAVQGNLIRVTRIMHRSTGYGWLDD